MINDETVIGAIRKNGWDVYKNEDPDVPWTPSRGYILENCTPGGEQLFFVISGDKDVLLELRGILNGFDVDNHVKERIRSDTSNNMTIQELIEDAEQIKEMIHDLYLAMESFGYEEGCLTIWVNDQMIPKEVIRLMEVVYRTDWEWFRSPHFDGVNGTITFPELPRTIAYKIIHSINTNFKLVPIDFEYTMNEE